jgi:excisionase family DNA binding protein
LNHKQQQPERPAIKRRHRANRNGASPERQALKLDEVGKRLGISRNSVYAAARRGEIPTIRIGRLLLVPVPALERMLDVRT